jgi:hypothetical protein
MTVILNDELLNKINTKRLVAIKKRLRDDLRVCEGNIYHYSDGRYTDEELTSWLEKEETSEYKKKYIRLVLKLREYDVKVTKLLATREHVGNDNKRNHKTRDRNIK